MTDERQVSLEQALARTEADAEAARKAAAALTASLKRFRGMARSGNLRDLRQAIAASEQALSALRQQFANAKAGWDFDEEAYFSNGAYVRELVETAQRMGLRIFELDDRLYAYPSLVRLLPNERAVLVDKTRERRLRPSVLVSHLKDLQARRPRFRPESFLESLLDAYTTIVATRGKDLFGSGTVVKLLEVYELFTLLPGAQRDYSRQEFARDIYLLDQSGVTTTRKGYTVSFPASSGTRSASSTVRIITEDGREKLYYGISFTPGG